MSLLFLKIFNLDKSERKINIDNVKNSMKGNKMINYDKDDLREQLRGGWLKSLRYYHSLTQDQLSEILVCSRKLIWDWERENRVIPSKWLLKLYDLCEVPKMSKRKSEKSAWVQSEVMEIIKDFNERYSTDTGLNSLKHALNVLTYENQKEMRKKAQEEIDNAVSDF